MFPLSDDNSDRRTTPYVNYLIVLINVLVFVIFQQLGNNEQFTNAFSVVPKDILTGQAYEGHVALHNPLTGEPQGSVNLYAPPVSVYFTLLTSMFMHGGFAHIGGNMLYLWIFGDNLEDLMGHFKYLLFYLICGIVASLSHVFMTASLHQNLLIPSLGASGAISGVLGAYILLFPNRRVTVIFLRQLMNVPAYVALGIWIIFQLIESTGLLGGEESGGVAYAAHIGGFIAGIILVKLFARQPEQSYKQREWI
jgi:membrane associated rhomboid family serine protease